MELKHKIQNLIDDDLIKIENPKESSNEDTYLKQDQTYEHMSSSGPLIAFTYSIIPPFHIEEKLSNIPPSNKDPNSFHNDYVYPQGLPLKEIQANLHLATNFFHASKVIDSKPSCAIIPIVPISNEHPSSLRESLVQIQTPTLSLEVALCQETNQNYKEKSLINDQDQDNIPPYPIVDLSPISQESHDESFIPFNLFQEDTLSSPKLHIPSPHISYPSPKQG